MFPNSQGDDRFLSQKDAVEFVVDSLIQMNGGEIFVPKIPSFKITELAKVIFKGVNLKLLELDQVKKFTKF